MREHSRTREIMEKVLARAAGYEARVYYEGRKHIATRFAENAITQNLAGESESVRVILGRDGRQGSAAGNLLNDEALERLVERAAAACAVAQPDPEYMPPPPAQDYPTLAPRHSDEAAKLGPAELAAGIAELCAVARTEGYRASGLHQSERGVEMLLNSKGLAVHDEWTEVSLSTTMHGPRGSGHASAAGESPAAVNPGRVAGVALANAISAQDPRDIEPGDYTVIMEPSAVWGLLYYLMDNMDARATADGVTAFSELLGKKIFADCVNLGLRLDEALLPVCPFGEDGLATRPTTWVKDGVLERLRHRRYWAERQGESPDPALFPLFMAGEDRSVADLVASCERGLLVKRLWYIRYVDKRELLLTGMTRDGVYLIEDGVAKYPVKNLRFNESPLTFLKNARVLSRPERVASWEKSVLPAVLSDGFTFDSKTESL